MTDVWRIKRYNPHRVLVGVSDTLEPPYDGFLLCVTAGQANIIRNLLRYATYRSTWASEYHEQYYLAPTEDEWDALQKVVADLESRLSMCEELTAAFNRMAAALECACTTSQGTSGIVQQLIDENVYRLTYSIPNYTDDRPVDTARCAIANLVWQGAFEMVTGVIQPAQTSAVEGLLPLVLGELADWLGRVIEWAVGPVLDLVRAAINAWVQDELAAVAAAYTANRQALVCAVYEGLAIDVGTAVVNAQSVISGIEGLSAIDVRVMRILYQQYFIGLQMDNWVEQSEWAIAHASGVSCASCEQNPESTLCDDPIHPALYTGDVIFGSNVISMGDGVPPSDCTHMGPAESAAIDNPVTGSYMIDAEAVWYSGRPTENTVGYVILKAWDGDEWINLANVTCTTSGPAGTVFETSQPDQGPYNMTLYSQLKVSMSPQPLACVQAPGLPEFNVLGFCFILTPEA